MVGRWKSVVLLSSIFVAVCVHAQDHHGHSHEPAHFKYSREANEAVPAAGHEERHHEHHGHSHEDHGHSHDHHGHTHEEHGHSHDGGGCPYANQHAQEPAGHSHSHGGKSAAKQVLHDEGGYTGALSFMNDARTRLWVHAIGATLLISIAPFIILFFIPIQSNTAESGPLLKVLLSFGAGGLIGDAFLHLIPHATPAGGSHSHSHSHSHGAGEHHEPHDMSVGGWVVAGILSFLVVEKIVRIIRGEEGHGHSHGHSHGGAKKTKNSDDEHEGEQKKGDKKKTTEKKEKKECKEDIGGIKVAAYLNLVADFAHNFTDGLAIGASFLAGSTIGFVTMVTVLVHEVPHEIGDFAILIQSGYTRRKAMLMQLVTAAGALSGCVLSLYVADGSLADSAASSWVLPFTAGGFIYIALVSVIPELLEGSSFAQSLKEIFALLLGIFLMYLIAVYE